MFSNKILLEWNHLYSSSEKDIIGLQNLWRGKRHLKMKLQNTLRGERFLTFHSSDVEDRCLPTTVRKHTKNKGSII